MVSVGLINASMLSRVLCRSVVSASAEFGDVTLPYGIIVNPIGGDFYVMDAKDYLSSGKLNHFLPDGTFDWSVWTGDIPGHAAFLFK